VDAIGDPMWGDGFIPRVNERSRAGVMQALGTGDLFTSSTTSVRHMIVDPRLAMQDNDLRAGFLERNVSMIIDTQAWRYSDPNSWGSNWGMLPYAPSRPFMPTREWIRGYVIGDLGAQVSMGASYLLLPGWYASLTDIDRAVDVAEWTLEAYEQFRRSGVLIPAIAWLPVMLTSGAASLAAAMAYVESGLVQGVYAQFNTVSGLSEPLDRARRMVKLILDIQNLGLPVIAGHLGPIGVVMRAIGVSAVDCGPCETQSFSYSDLVRNSIRRTKDQSSSRGGGPPVRMWVSELGQTITSSQLAAIRQNPAAHAEIVCRRACHRFRSGRETLEVAVQHSLLSLDEEARKQSGRPCSVRIDAARRSLMAMKTSVPVVDEALRQGRQKTLRQGHLDVQLALLDEVSPRHGAA
jgi:hypothetical protein